MGPTWQVSKDTHIELDPEVLRYANHSCAPSVFFDTAAGKVVALTDLQAGDEVGSTLGVVF
eukprot:1139338-Pelagomonas_calceolata.AAC.2